jgi:hypothetical protein
MILFVEKNKQFKSEINKKLTIPIKNRPLHTISKLVITIGY